MKNILEPVYQKLKKMNPNLISFRQLKYVKKEELARTGKKATDLCFIKRIFQFLLDLVLVTKYQKKSWKYQKKNLRNSVR